MIGTIIAGLLHVVQVFLQVDFDGFRLDQKLDFVL